MRVLLVLDHHVKYSAGLALGLARAGSEVAMVTRDHDWEFGLVPGAMRRWMTAELGGEVRWEAVEGRVRDPRGLRSAWRARRAARGLRPDVVHVQDSVVDDVRLLAVAPPRPGRYAMTLHDASTHPGDEVRSAWKRRLLDRLVRDAGVVFVHAEAVRDQLLAREPAARVEVVPHGVRPPLVEPLPATPSLLFFGRISRYKGLDVLLDALPRLWERVPDARLTIAGEGLLPGHELLADPRVTLRHEHVAEEELPALFAAATCVVLPYLEASQSGVGSLARRFGRAMVVTDAGGLPDLAADGAGEVVPAGDADALGAALARVLADPAAARTKAEATARAVTEGASFDRVAELTLDGYARRLGVGAPAASGTRSPAAAARNSRS